MAKDKETLLITGGLGFVGSSLAKRLCDKYNIIIVDFDHSNSAEKIAKELQDSGAEVIHGDIASIETWKKIQECQYIFHAAAQVAAEVSWLKPDLDFRTNVHGTFLVAEHARKHNASVIYCNTIRVYDPDSVEIAMKRHGKVSEKCATIDISNKPQPPFALSKHLGECILRIYSNMYGLNVISLRMSGIVGTGQVGSKNHGWLTNIVRCAVKKKKFMLFGDGNQTRDVLHINDFLNLIKNQLTHFEKYSKGGFAVYNVGGGTANVLRINQVIEILETELSREMTIIQDNSRIGEPKRYATNLDSIRETGWEMKITETKKIIKELIDWHKGGRG